MDVARGQIPNASTPMPRIDDRRWDEVHARVQQRGEAHAGVLAGRAQPGEHSGCQSARSRRTATATTSLPPSHADRETGRTSDWSSVPLGLLRACRGDLTGGDEGDQDGHDEEAHAEHCVRRRCPGAELGEHLLHR